MPMRHRAPFAGAAVFAFGLACGGPPRRPSAPALTPQTAGGLLNYSGEAQKWLTYVRGQDPSCTYNVDLPSQKTHQTEIDLSNIVVCGGHPAPIQYQADVSFAYDAATNAWVIKRFSS
ncbi:MAG TPA: hypothetical protein VF283_12150 [Bryobacteraceae bacterium]